MKKDIANQFKWVSLFRLISVTVIVGIAIIFFRKQIFLTPTLKINQLWMIIILTYILTFLYWVSFLKEKFLSTTLWISLIFDTFIFTAIIYYTGGSGSEFTFLYFFPIISGSIFFFLKGGVSTAIFCIFSYGVMLNLELHRVFNPILLFKEISINIDILYRLYLQATFFFLVATTSGYLAEKFRQIKLDTATIIKSMKSGIIAIDLKGNIIYKNDNADKILGKRAIFEFTLQNEGFQEIELEDKVIGINVSWLKNAKGEKRGTLIIIYDLTQTKITERLATIGTFAGNLAHEIRNPVTAIQGSCELIKQDVDKKDKEKLIDIVLTQSKRLNKIVTNFLSFAKPTTTSLSEVEIGEIIRESVKLAAQDTNFQGDGIKIIQKEPIYIKLDTEQIKTAFLNIIKNAIQATNGVPCNGKIKIEIEKKDKEVIIYFNDTGEGIPEDKIKQIFTPFYTTRKDGTGLGLSIALKIIENHKGRIEVQSKLNEGTTFTVHLPI